MRSKPTRKLLSLLLTFCLILGMVPRTVFAHGEPSLGDSGDTATPGNATPTDVVIAAFDELPEDVLFQGYDFGEITSQSGLILPDTLTGMDEDENAVNISGVTWESAPAFDGEVSIDPPGYLFTPTLQSGYALADGVSAPVISVFIRSEGGAEIMPIANDTTTITTQSEWDTFRNTIGGWSGGGNTVIINSGLSLNGELTIPAAVTGLTIDGNGSTIDGQIKAYHTTIDLMLKNLTVAPTGGNGNGAVYLSYGGTLTTQGTVNLTGAEGNLVGGDGVTSLADLTINASDATTFQGGAATSGGGSGVYVNSDLTLTGDSPTFVGGNGPSGYGARTDNGGSLTILSGNPSFTGGVTADNYGISGVYIAGDLIISSPGNPTFTGADGIGRGSDMAEGALVMGNLTISAGSPVFTGGNANGANWDSIAGDGIVANGTVAISGSASPTFTGGNGSAISAGGYGATFANGIVISTSGTAAFTAGTNGNYGIDPFTGVLNLSSLTGKITAVGNDGAISTLNGTIAYPAGLAESRKYNGTAASYELDMSAGGGSVTGTMSIAGTMGFNLDTTVDNLATHGWAWDASTATLTLNSTYTGEKIFIGCALTDAVTIEVIGAVTVTDSLGNALSCMGSLTIADGGSGTLTATSSGSFGIFANGNLTIGVPTIAKGGIDMNQTGGISVGTGGSLTTGGAGTAGDVTGDLTVSGGSVTVNGDVTGDLTVSDGNVTITGTVAGTQTITGGTVNVNGQPVAPGGQEINGDISVGGQSFAGNGKGANGNFGDGDSTTYGAPSGNTLTITSGDFTGEPMWFYGGFTYRPSEDATDNQVIVNGGSFIGNDQSIYGGQSTNFTGGAVHSRNNTVTINDFSGTIMTVYGNSGSSSGDATGNKVIINGGSGNIRIIYGGSALNDANGNEVEINADNVTVIDKITGGNSFLKDATNNTVTISAHANLSGVLLMGGDSLVNGFTGNTLNLNVSGQTVNGLANFENYNFKLPSTLQNSGVMLVVTGGDGASGSADIGGTTIGISFTGASTLSVGDKITLIDSSVLGLTGTPVNTTVSAAGYTFGIAVEGGKLIATVTAAPGGTTPSAACDITAFAINGVSGTISGNAITVNLPSGTNKSNLIPTFTLSPGAAVKVGGTPQTSGVASNDFTSPVSYTVTAQNGTSSKTYTVTVNVASASAAITGIAANPTSIASHGGSSTVTITGINLNGSSIDLYVDGVLSATINHSGSETTATGIVTIPANATTSAKTHSITAALNGTLVTGKSATVTVSGQSGGGNGGGSGSGGSSYTPAPSITTDKKTDQPIIAKQDIKATVDKDGKATVTITELQIKALIDKAKATGSTADGIGVTLNVTFGTDGKSAEIKLDEKALALLSSSGMERFEVSASLGGFIFDKAAIKEMNSQATGAVTISIVPVTKLSDAAKALIGNRPVFDFTASFVKDGKTTNITSLGQGTVSLAISYKAAAGEKNGNLYGVYVDGNGKPLALTNSSYDNSRVIFSRSSLSVYGVGYKASADFADTTGHWAKDNIDFVVSRGLIASTTATTFAPDAAITRADFLMALGKLSGADVSGYKTSSFTDVKSADAAMPYLEWAVVNKIVQGIGNSQFGPSQQITREQMAVMMQNYAKVAKFTLPVSRQYNTFADDSKINAWAKDAVKAIAQAGIIVGKDDGKFDPQGHVTRAEASTILRCFVELVIDESTSRGWVNNDSGHWMYYNWKGERTTGWLPITDSDSRYYFDANGVMVAGKWLQINGKWYYFYADGKMARSTTVDGYTAGEDGTRKE